MDNESLDKLRLDKRLIGRRGWIDAEDLQRELEALPDSSDKIAPPPAGDADRASSSDASG